MTDPKTLQHLIEGPPDAPVLVLGPALGATWHMWDRQIPELAAGRRVLRYDLPGHGGASADPADSVAELADRLLATLEELGIDRFGYAGCQLGSAVGIELALRHPDRLTSLGLVSAAARFDSPEAWRQLCAAVRSGGLARIAAATPERWFTEAFRTVQPAIAEWAVQMVGTIDPDCYTAACEALASFDVRSRLDRIAVPTLVVAGAEDQAAPPADARALVAGIPDARLAVVPSAAHLIPVEQPRAVTDLLVDHLCADGQAPAGARPAAAPRPAAPRPAPRPAASAPAVAAAAARAAVPVPPAAAAVPAAAAPPPALAPAPAAPVPAEVPAAGSAGGRQDPYPEGLRLRREVLGDAHVEQRMGGGAGAPGGGFQEFVTRYAWGEVWSRPGLDRRTRSCITLTALVARGHLDALADHTRAALRNGLAPAEIEEVLMHAAVYCGVPAADSAFAVAQRVIEEETDPPR